MSRPRLYGLLAEFDTPAGIVRAAQERSLALSEPADDAQPAVGVRAAILAPAPWPAVQSDRVIAESVDKVGSPVILITRRVKRIKRALEHREWHRLHAKQGWRTEFTDGVKEGCGLLCRARVAPTSHIVFRCGIREKVARRARLGKRIHRSNRLAH